MNEPEPLAVAPTAPAASAVSVETPVAPVRTVTGYSVPGEGPSTLISIFTVAALFALWWVATHLGWIRDLFLPTPERIMVSFIDAWKGDIQGGRPLLDHFWASLMRVFAAFILACLTAIPAGIAMGVSRPALAYPRLVELANALLRLLSGDTDPLGLTASPGAPPPAAPTKKAADRVATDRIPGKAHASLVDLLAVMKEELASAKALPDLPPLTIAPDARDPLLERLSRPRGNLEGLRTIFLAQDPAFSVGEPGSMIAVAARDSRGFAKVVTAGGKVPSPFVDLTGPKGAPDGLADEISAP